VHAVVTWCRGVCVLLPCATRGGDQRLRPEHQHHVAYLAATLPGAHPGGERPDGVRLPLHAHRKVGLSLGLGFNWKVESNFSTFTQVLISIFHDSILLLHYI